MAKPTSKPKQTSTALAKYDEVLAQIAASSKKAVQGISSGGGNFISLKGGVMTYQKAAIPGNALRCVVVAWILENQFYSEAYDEDNPTPPTCYAFGMEKETMAPKAEDVTEVQSEDCASCSNLEWGSAEKGKGKACAEVARLALISESDFEDIQAAEIANLKVNVTSMKFWGGYLRQLQEIYNEKPSCAFVTIIKIVPYEKQPGWRLDFQLEEPIDDPETMGAIIEQYKKVSKTIATPYPKVEQIKPAPKPKGKPKKAPAPIPSPASTAPKKGFGGVKAPKF